MPAELFNHLVGTAKQRVWDGDAESLRGLEVDDQLDFRGLLDRQVGRLLALENPSLRDVAAELAKLGFVNERGTEFAASSIASIVG